MGNDKASFEAWVLTKAEESGYRHMGLLLKCGEAGNYATSWVDSAWMGWQAAQRQGGEPRKQFFCTRCGTIFDAIGEEKIKEAFVMAAEHDKHCQGRSCDSQTTESDTQQGLSSTGDAQGGEAVAWLCEEAHGALVSVTNIRDEMEAYKKRGRKIIPLTPVSQPAVLQPDWIACSERLPTEAAAKHPCWACKKPVSIDQKRGNDGDCPHCGSELDEELWPQKTTQRQGGEAVAPEFKALLSRTAANLMAAVSLLEDGGHEAAPSDSMFRQMLSDYKHTISDVQEFLRATPQPAVPETDWIACSERLPTEADADCDGRVWHWSISGEPIAMHWTLIREHEPLQKGYWKPTGLKRPEPPEDV